MIDIQQTIKNLEETNKTLRITIPNKKIISIHFVMTNFFNKDEESLNCKPLYYYKIVMGVNKDLIEQFLISIIDEINLYNQNKLKKQEEIKIEWI